MLRSIPLAAVVLALGCTSSARPRLATSNAPPLSAYAIALEEAVGRYEAEVQAAVSSAQSVSPGRFEALFGASLRARGLTRDGFRDLASREPRFYFTQQALYAHRLARLDAAVQPVAAPQVLAAH